MSVYSSRTKDCQCFAGKRTLTRHGRKCDKKYREPIVRDFKVTGHHSVTGTRVYLKASVTHSFGYLNRKAKDVGGKSKHSPHLRISHLFLFRWCRKRHLRVADPILLYVKMVDKTQLVGWECNTICKVVVIAGWNTRWFFAQEKISNEDV